LPFGAGLEAPLGEALELGHDYVGTGHVLLGLLHDHRSPAAAS
jgi:hypothetical protein